MRACRRLGRRGFILSSRGVGRGVEGDVDGGFSFGDFACSLGCMAWCFGVASLKDDVLGKCTDYVMC